MGERFLLWRRERRLRATAREVLSGDEVLVCPSCRRGFVKRDGVPTMYATLACSPTCANDYDADWAM